MIISAVFPDERDSVLVGLAHEIAKVIKNKTDKN
jgi:hypothetical protein